MARPRNDKTRRSPGPRDTDTWIELRGRVVRLLHDPEDRHQRFILDTGDRRTILVAHNIGIAERVPLGLGDRVTVRGLYEWNDLGGLLHWTHADPMGQDEAGFIRFRNKTFQ
ncbi:MAG: DUF3465 domain-containing protein [Woeseiaceae bacterium]|nr:DUF3465 domain-containing protein [Woeseiaceae bacterium]